MTAPLQGIETVREMIPLRVRRIVYATYIVLVIVTGAVQVAADGGWIDTAEDVLQYLGIPLATLALVNAVPVQAEGAVEDEAVAGPESPLPAGTPVDIEPSEDGAT